MDAADIVIIGGGIIGCSIAYHLASKGIKNIVVVDSSIEPGCGSTGKATGGFRSQFGSGINIQLSLISRKKILSFKDETGFDPGFEQKGYLFIAQSDDEFQRLKEAGNLQKECGLTEAEILSAGDIKKLNKHINYDGITGGAFCQTDGFIKPLQILNGYLHSAKKLGVTFLFNTEVKQLKFKNKSMLSAVTSKGNINAGIFINAAGAWAGELAKKAGVNIPIVPLKRQVCRVEQKNILPENMPMTIWSDNSFHFRMRDEYLILLMPADPEENNPFDTNTEKTWLEKTFEIGKTRIPILTNCSVDYNNSWAGLYEMSPDEHILLGLAPGFDNFYLANGSSGHGVMHSPAIGQLLAEYILDRNTSIDISSLSPNRFKEDKSIHSIAFF